MNETTSRDACSLHLTIKMCLQLSASTIFNMSKTIECTLKFDVVSVPSRFYRLTIYFSITIY